MKNTLAKFDFHLHSCWSYDAVTPVEYYFQEAERRGVTHIAITDHMNMDAIGDVLAAAAKHPSIHAIPGVELTVSCELGSFDMICLGLPVNPSPELQKVWDDYRKWQHEYGNAICDGLTKAGFPYSKDDMLSLLRRYRPERALALQGVTRVRDTFQALFLVEEKHYFADRNALNEAINNLETPPYPAADDVLPIMRNAGGVVFIAHPTWYFNINDINRMDALRERLGFDGIECAHTKVPHELTPFYLDYCRKHHLLATAGTDCHCKPETLPVSLYGARRELACHIGEDSWRDAILERLGQDEK